MRRIEERAIVGRRAFAPLLLVVSALVGCGAGSQPGPAVVVAPYADLRSDLTSRRPGRQHDDAQQTQVLYGESVELVGSADGRSFVRAQEQPEFTHSGSWQGYPGWIDRKALALRPAGYATSALVQVKWAPIYPSRRLAGSPALHLPLGSRVRGERADGVWRLRLLDGSIGWASSSDVVSAVELEGLGTAEIRRRIVEIAERFLGEPYFWGGRIAEPTWAGATRGIGGLDCSALVNLAYRLAGIEIPRDSHEQFLRATPAESVEIGDLIFLSAETDPQRIVHVMVYAGGDLLVEAPRTNEPVRRIGVEVRLGRSLEELTPGSRVGKRTVYFGSYLRGDRAARSD